MKVEIAELERFTSEASQLKEEIEKLITLSVNEKRLFFAETDFNFDVSGLLATGVIRNAGFIQGGKSIEIGRNPFYHYLFYLRYKDEFIFSIEDGIGEFHKFIDRVDSLFENGTNVWGRSNFIKAFRIFLYLYSNLLGNDTLTAHMQSISDLSDCHRFLDVYTEVLPHLVATPEQISLHLTILEKFLANELYQASRLGKALETLIIIQPITAVPLWTAVSRHDSLYFKTIQVNILVAQFKLDASFIENIDKLLETEHMDVALSTIRFLELTDTVILHEFLKKVAKAKSEDKTYNSQLPAFYAYMLRSPIGSEKDTQVTCFLNLQRMLCSADNDYRTHVINELGLLSDFKGIVTDIITTLISEDTYDDNYSRAFDHIYIRYDVASFFKFLGHYCEKVKLKFDAHNFEGSIGHLHTSDSATFQAALLAFVTDNSGAKRFAGHAIFKYLVQLGHFQFAVKIVDLTPSQQYRLIIALFYDFADPTFFLALLIPLVHSKHPVIPELLACKTEQLVNSYGRRIVDILTSEIDNDVQAESQLLKRIEDVYEEFKTKIELKNSIKELNPYYTQGNLANRFYRSFTKFMSRGMSESMREHSFFLSRAKTTKLAKNGGWLDPSTGNVNKLSTFESSFELPREYFITPEKYDLNLVLTYLDSWEEEFSNLDELLAKAYG